LAFGDFLDLAEEAARAAQMDPADTSGDLARAKQAINIAYLNVCASGDPWAFMETEGQWTTVAGTDTYTFSSIATAMSITGASIREISSLTNDTDGWVLDSMGQEALESYAGSTQADQPQGSPTQWARWGAQGAPRIRLFPNPDAVYTIGAFVYLTGAALSNNTDTPIIPLEWRHQVLVPHAAWRLLSQEGGNESLVAARQYRDEYNEAFRKMRDALAVFRRPTGNAISPGFFERESGQPGAPDWVWGL
jgi:hypothetical protein